MTKRRQKSAKAEVDAVIKPVVASAIPASDSAVSSSSVKLKTHRVSSIVEYTTLVADLKTQMWFRGHGMGSTYKLKPSLYRKKQSLSGNDLYELEHEMIKRFRERSTPFVGNKFLDPKTYDGLSILFYMQHYGIPTRLLDWSENPFVGLYFALNDINNYDYSTGKYKEDACVWMLNPDLWNNKAVICDPPMGLISVPNSDPVNGYLPNSESDARPVRHRPLAPISITGFHNSPRIVAQRGVFVLFGAENKDMDEFYNSGAYADDVLVKIDIDKDHIESMRNSLYYMGIADSVIYPDMQGFSAEIAKHFRL